MYRYAGVGLQFAATLGVFGLLGWWLDGRLGSGPWLLIGGVFLGFFLGTVSLVSKLSPRRGRGSAPSDEHPTRKGP